METGDWRTQLPRDFRGKIVRRIIDTLKKRTPPSDDPSSQLRKIQCVALKFEEKVYMDSSDQKEYVRKIMVKLMAAEGSHPNFVPKSSSDPPGVGLKALNLDQGQSVAVQSAVQSQACEVPEQRSLLDVQNNITCGGVSANLAPAQSTVSASAQVLLPSQNPYSLKSVGNSSGKGIPFNESASNVKQEQVKQHSPRIDTHPIPHHCRQVKQEYIDPQQNHQQLNPNLCKQVKQEHVAPSCITQQHKVHQHQYIDPQQTHQQNHQQLNPNLCNQVKHEHAAPSCITQQHKVHQQHHHHQKLVKHTQQQIPQESVIRAPLLRTSEMHVAPLSDFRQDQSSFKQTQSVIKYNHQRAFGQTNPQDTPGIHQKVSSTPEQAQSQKQTHAFRSRLTPTNLQQNHLSGQSNGLCDLQQQHHRLPSQHNNLLQEFKGQSVIGSSANHETQKNHISVPHGSSQLPEGGSSGQRQCESKMRGETRHTDFALLPNQVQESQPQNLERQLQTQAQLKKMSSLLSSDIPACTYGQGIINTDNLQEELYGKLENLKSKYLASLTGIEQKIVCYFQKLQSIPEHPERNNIKKLKAMKHMHHNVKFYIMNLNVSKSKITPAWKEKLGLIEEKIVSFLQIFEQRKPATLLQDGRPSNVPTMPQSVELHSQASQGHTREEEKKLPSQSVTMQCSGTNTQHSNVTNVVKVSDSQSEPPILQHDMVHMQKNLTEQDSERGNSLKSANQVTSDLSETLLVSNAVSIGGQQAHGAPEAIHCSFDGLNAADQPIQRLIKMVKSMPSKALSSFASDIGSVVCMTDRMSGPDTVQGSGAAISDLADTTIFNLQKRYLARQNMTVRSRIMKRHRSSPISFGALENGNINESLSQLNDMEKFDSDSPAISNNKRRRLEVNHLLEEITAINQRLIDTVLDISDEEIISSVASAPILNGEGTIVRCSFIAVAIDPSLKAELELLPIQPLRLLVPANYPFCSPIFVDKLKVEVSDDQDLSAKVKSKLNFSLRNLTEPLSLGEIARTWDVCARAVISEYAEQNGGGSFSSKYGTWEDCLSAAAA